MTSASEDPVVRSARREAIAVLSVAAVALIYTITTCYRMGFDAKQHELKFVDLGAGIAFPDWVFWGIVVPWGVCFLISGVFAFGFMQDADLGEELPDGDEDDVTAQTGDAPHAG